MMRHRPGDTALAATNRHAQWRRTRRAVNQFFQHVTPRIDVKGVLRETTGSPDSTNHQPRTTDRRAWKP